MLPFVILLVAVQLPCTSNKADLSHEQQQHAVFRKSSVAIRINDMAHEIGSPIIAVTFSKAVWLVPQTCYLSGNLFEFGKHLFFVFNEVLWLYAHLKHPEEWGLLGSVVFPVGSSVLNFREIGKHLGHGTNIRGEKNFSWPDLALEMTDFVNDQMAIYRLKHGESYPNTEREYQKIQKKILAYILAIFIRQSTLHRMEALSPSGLQSVSINALVWGTYINLFYILMSLYEEGQLDPLYNALLMVTNKAIAKVESLVALMNNVASIAGKMDCLGFVDGLNPVSQQHCLILPGQGTDTNHWHCERTELFLPEPPGAQ